MLDSLESLLTVTLVAIGVDRLAILDLIVFLRKRLWKMGLVLEEDIP